MSEDPLVAFLDKCDEWRPYNDVIAVFGEMFELCDLDDDEVVAFKRIVSECVGHRQIDIMCVHTLDIPLSDGAFQCIQDLYMKGYLPELLRFDLESTGHIYYFKHSTTSPYRILRG